MCVSESAYTRAKEASVNGDVFTIHEKRSVATRTSVLTRLKGESKLEMEEKKMYLHLPLERLREIIRIVAKKKALSLSIDIDIVDVIVYEREREPLPKPKSR